MAQRLVALGRRWYHSIVSGGYSYNPGEHSNVAFSPMLPALMKLVSLLLGQSDKEGILLAGLIVSNLALLIGLSYLVALVRLDFEEMTATRTSLYVLVFPTSLFLSAVYPESLFLAFTAAAFYYARRGRWWLAAALGGLAAFTRTHGVLLLIPLAFEYLYQRRFDPLAVRTDLLALALVPSGLAAHLLYLGVVAGDPLVIFRAQAAWKRQLTPPWDTFRLFFEAPLAVHGGRSSMVDLGFVLLFVVLVVLSWRYVRPSYALFAGVLFVTFLSSGMLRSVMRYGVTLFPVFIVLAIAGRNLLFDRVYLVLASGLASLFMAMFALWYFVA